MSKTKLLEAIEFGKERFESEEDFAKDLNQLFGDVDVCGLKYGSGDLLLEIDPIAFSVAMSDSQEYTTMYKCPICNEEFDDEEKAKYCCQEEEEEKG